MHGPFENGSNLYVVLLDKTANTVEVWKSTDGGNNWTEQDSANHKTSTTTVANKSCYVAQMGTTLHILYVVTPNVVNIVPFSMSTDTFGTVVTGGPAILNNILGVPPAFLCVRSNDDLIVYHQGSTETVMGTAYRRVKYSRYESGSWTATNVDVAGTGVQINLDARSALLGSSDRAHFFWTNSTGFVFRHRSLTSGNTLNTDASAGTGADYLANDNYHVGIPNINSADDLIIPINGQNGNDMSVVRGTSADNPTWTTTDVSTVNNPEATNANPGAVAVNGTTVYVVWPNDADQDIYYNSDGGTNTWGSDTEWKDAITCNGINANYLANNNGIGVLYDDGGTVKFDLLSLATPTKTRPWRPTRWHYVNRRSMF